MDDGKLCKDRRRWLRLLYDKPMRVIVEGGKSHFICKIKNLSLKGAFVVLTDNSMLQEGDIIRFEILLHNSKRDLNICGKASIVRKVVDNGYGLSFLEMGVEDFSRLRRLLSLNVADAERIVKDFEGMLD